MKTIQKFAHIKLSLICSVAVLFPMMAFFHQACAFSGPDYVRFARPDPSIPLGESAPVKVFIDEMVGKHGFDRSALMHTFSEISYSESAVGPFTPEPEETGVQTIAKPKDWREYRARFVTPLRVGAGISFWNRYADTLESASIKYGVAPEIIVGIIGVETRYGQNTGRHRVLDALTTLAFDYPDTPNRIDRMLFFREELEHTLLYARDAGIDPLSLTGSYAGAIGWPQFMPGSIRKYAVDFDGDGRIDLVHSPRDAIGSVANYLASYGWISGQPTVFPAQVDGVSGQSLEALVSAGLQAAFWLSDLQAFGVNAKGVLPDEIKYGLVDLEHGDEPKRYWLATDNFFAITQYNRSYFYAMAVVELGREVRLSREALLNEDDY